MHLVASLTLTTSLCPALVSFSEGGRHLTTTLTVYVLEPTGLGGIIQIILIVLTESHQITPE